MHDTHRLDCFIKTVWQAYHSPASLGISLSNHRRMDGYEFFHLKQFLSYDMFIISFLISFVKNPFIFQQSRPFFFIYSHKCNNRILKSGIICLNISRNTLINLFIYFSNKIQNLLLFCFNYYVLPGYFQENHIPKNNNST